jgi:hypothetical protein
MLIIKILKSLWEYMADKGHKQDSQSRLRLLILEEGEP